MASQSLVNGGSSIIDPLAPEQSYTMDGTRKDNSHLPTVEDVVDEEDLANAHPNVGTDPGALSEKAAGKQRANDDLQDDEAPKPKPVKLDVSSEEAFPSLGAGKGPAPVATGSLWGAKPAIRPVNGVNGKGPASGVSSRASTPASGVRSSAPGGTVHLPGRHEDWIAFQPNELTPAQQLKTSRAEIIRDINRRSKAKVEMRQGPEGTVRFYSTGPKDAVESALREVSRSLSAKLSIKVPIPASVRSHIIGRGGATIQNIMKKSGARIQVPKQEGSEDAEDDSTVIDVVVEGDATSCKVARAEINKIVDERTSNVNLRLRDIPPEFFPFLAGPRNSRLENLHEGRDARAQIPHYYQWVDQAPVVPRPGQSASFAPHPQHSIGISGDRIHAQELQAELERQVAQLQRQLSLAQTPIERGRHQFIAGNRGQALHDFFEETGCALILPPPGVDSEELTIVGPPDQIDNAINKVMDLAASMAMASVDVARQHAQDQAHARALTRYLQQRQAIQQLEQTHNASIALPDRSQANGPTAWEIFAKEGKDTMRARADIMNLISGHPPSRLRHVDVDPFYHQHLRQNHARQLRSSSGVHLLFPTAEELGHSPQLVLVYEAPGSPSEYELPRQKPAAAEVQQFEKALQQAEKELLQLINAQESIKSQHVDANPKFHDKVRRFVDREQASLPSEQFPVQLLFGPQGPASQQQKGPQNNLSVRGPSSAVDDLYTKILSFLEQEEQDEKERAHTTSFEFPAKFANFLIGKRGENINRLREEFDVDIQVSDGKVELRGPPTKCNACKASILKSAAKWADETTHVLKVKQQYHRDLIGAKGSQVNRLQDRYNVHINFPRSQQPNDDDTASVAGSVRNARQQNPDEVIIKGPRKGADEARDELLSLLQYTIDNSHTATISVAQEQIPRLIGQGGREMEALRLSTGCQIDVPRADESVAPNGRAEIKLRGGKKQVEEAKKLLEEKVKVFDDTITKTVEVEKRHHKALIGSGGANIRDIIARAGGPTDSREIARTVRFPAPNSPESTIRVEGRAALVDQIVAELTAFADQRNNQITSTLAVDPSRHRLLIGRGGETRRALEAKLKVSLDVPKQGTGDDQVKITGQPADVEAAQAHLAELTKEQEGVTILVPKPLHHYVAENGQVFRKLRLDHGITVDHSGIQPPPRPTGAGAEASTRRVNAPLITDEPGAGADLSWQILETHPGLPSTDGVETIPWVLRGNDRKAAERAQATIEKAIEEAKQPRYTGYLILSDPKSYRFVVGPGGSSIKDVRSKTGCKIDVPKGNAGGSEAIEVAGQKENVEKAKELILEHVRQGQNASAGRRG